VENGIGREAPRELGELVKAYLERLVEGEQFCEGVLKASSGSRKTTTKKGEGVEWLGALRWCPREMLDLVNSKACRGEFLSPDRDEGEERERERGELTRVGSFQVRSCSTILLLLNSARSSSGSWRRPCSRFSVLMGGELARKTLSLSFFVQRD